MSRYTDSLPGNSARHFNGGDGSSYKDPRPKNVALISNALLKSSNESRYVESEHVLLPISTMPEIRFSGLSPAGCARELPDKTWAIKVSQTHLIILCPAPAPKGEK
jgi:hypothetical protein